MNEGSYQAFNYGADEIQPSKTSDLYGNARAGFIQKVYTVLSSNCYWIQSRFFVR